MINCLRGISRHSCCKFSSAITMGWYHLLSYYENWKVEKYFLSKLCKRFDIRYQSSVISGNVLPVLFQIALIYIWYITNIFKILWIIGVYENYINHTDRSASSVWKISEAEWKSDATTHWFLYFASDNLWGFPRTCCRHQMETFSALLVICAENSPVPGEFPAQRPVTRGFDVFFDLHLNKRLSK